MSDTPIAIDVNNLSKSFSKSPHDPLILSDISFQVPLGKVCCLLGPNGSGKTTLLKILAGLLSPTSGNVSLMGIDPAVNPIAARSQIGWMPADERGGFYGRLTAKENLNFFAAIQNTTPAQMKRHISNLALLLDINDEMDKKILTLSGGGKQKIGLARTLLHDPAVLLLDEPFRNLDPQMVQRFRRLLKDHLTRVQNKTVLLSTHQLDEARRVADLILFLQDGKIIKQIESRELEKVLKKQSVEEFYLKTVGSKDK